MVDYHTKNKGQSAQPGPDPDPDPMPPDPNPFPPPQPPLPNPQPPSPPTRPPIPQVPGTPTAASERSSQNRTRDTIDVVYCYTRRTLCDTSFYGY